MKTATYTLLCLTAALSVMPGTPARAEPGPAPAPVLLVLANRDFYAPDYGPLRSALEAEGLTVRVAAATLEPCVPHGGDPAEAVRPDVPLSLVNAAEYSALAFVGGWGASSYQYAFPGTYHEAAYRPDLATAQAVSRVIGDALAAGKPVSAICHGVSVLAWARVDGVSPLAGRRVAAYSGGAPGFRYGGVDHADGAVPTRWHVETNGAFMVPSGSVGDPATTTDDVIVDGHVITAEDWAAAPALGRTLASEVRRRQPPAPAGKRVLMVIANTHFWYREYAEPRAALEAAGIQVDVAAARAVTSYPHAGSGYTDADGAVRPDLSIADALLVARDEPERWSAIVFVGGWGASSYQYAYGGTYLEPAYNGSPAVRQDVSELIGLFVERDRWVTALCHGVTVLAYARVDGHGLLEGRTVVAWPGYAPAEVGRDGSAVQRLTRAHVEANGALVLPTNSVGDPRRSDDDVVVDGRIITGESFDAAAAFGSVLAGKVLSE